MRGAVMSGEFEDEYSATIDESLTKTDDLRESSDALLNDTIAVLAPAEPLCLGESGHRPRRRSDHAGSPAGRGADHGRSRAGSPESSPSATC